VAINTLRHHIGPGRTGTSIGSPAVLLGIYTAFYLAVVGMVHFMSSPDATAAITPDSAQQHAAAPDVPPESIGATGESPGAYVAKPMTSATDNSRECMPDAGIDAECIYN
jgi:hypothetical protein